MCLSYMIQLASVGMVIYVPVLHFKSFYIVPYIFLTIKQKILCLYEDI